MPTRYRGSEETTRALNAFINLVRATESIVGRLGAKLGRNGLTSAQFGVLEAVYHGGPVCQRALGEKLLRSRGNVTVVVNNLEKRGWIRRERQSGDRRMIRIELTPEGRALIERLFPEHAQEIASAFSILNRDEQEELRRICRKLGTGADEAQTMSAGCNDNVRRKPNENKKGLNPKKEQDNGIT